MEVLSQDGSAAEMNSALKANERLCFCLFVTLGVRNQPSKLLGQELVYGSATLGRKDARFSQEISLKSNRDVLLH
jgi:hypothetical protein